MSQVAASAAVIHAGSTPFACPVKPRGGGAWKRAFGALCGAHRQVRTPVRGPIGDHHEPQALDAAHHMHPFTDGAELAKGARVITAGQGVWLTDSEGNRDHRRDGGPLVRQHRLRPEELAEVAARQMEELSYYNTFFQTTHVPAIALAAGSRNWRRAI
jgi:hypothetical protein